MQSFCFVFSPSFYTYIQQTTGSTDLRESLNSDGNKDQQQQKPNLVKNENHARKKKDPLEWAWWHILVILALGRLKQGDLKLAGAA
jgi:hypothetical protein